MISSSGDKQYSNKAIYPFGKKPIFPNGPQLQEIDHTLARFHLFRLHNFHYEPGDCLFNALAVLTHFRCPLKS